MGIIELDPMRLLEDGIRSQTARRIAATCARLLVFPNAPPPLVPPPLSSAGRDSPFAAVFGSRAPGFGEMEGRWVSCLR